MDALQVIIENWRPGDWDRTVPIWVSVGGLSIGAMTGLVALIFPTVAASQTHLQPNPTKPGAFAEFRATFGGLYLGAHGAALVFMIAWALGFETMAGAPLDWTAMGAAAVCGALWIGGAIGRLVSMFADKTNSGLNQVAVSVDFAVGVAILYPWIMRAMVF
jgi:hypothetical protein